MGLGTTDTADGQTYTRSNNDFGPLAPAVLTGHVNGTSTSINLGAGGTYPRTCSPSMMAQIMDQKFGTLGI